MAKLPGQRPPEFLSTHPEPEGRIETIKQQLPQAMAAFRPHPKPGDTPLPSPQEIQGPTRYPPRTTISMWSGRSRELHHPRDQAAMDAGFLRPCPKETSVQQPHLSGQPSLC